MASHCAWVAGPNSGHSSKLNKEHALGQQMGPLIDGPIAYTSQRITVGTDPENTSQRTWTSGTPTGWISRAFCETCNGGWMARLDDAAKPVLDKLLASTGEAVEITADECDAVAIWAYKLSLVFEFVAGNIHHEDHVRHDLFRDQSVPSHAAVALRATSFSYATALYGIQTGKILLPGCGDAVIFTLLMKHLIIQVVSTTNGQLAFDPEHLTPLRDGARTMICPRAGVAPAVWSPCAAVDSEHALRSLIMGQPFPV